MLEKNRWDEMEHQMLTLKCQSWDKITDSVILYSKKCDAGHPYYSTEKVTPLLLTDMFNFHKSYSWQNAGGQIWHVELFK